MDEYGDLTVILWNQIAVKLKHKRKFVHVLNSSFLSKGLFLRFFKLECTCNFTAVNPRSKRMIEFRTDVKYFRTNLVISLKQFVLTTIC